MPKLLASSPYAATPQTPHWQLALGPDGLPYGGLHHGVAQQLGDISQCIRIILTTPKGSDPLRPDFGCDALKYLDMPLPTARPHLVREIRSALAWEPRISVESVSIQQGDRQSGGQSGGWAVARITWSTVDLSVRSQSTSVALGAAS